MSLDATAEGYQASVAWQSPSNIALIKYWGKKEGGPQLPANPSLSFTLDACRTQSRLHFRPRQKDQPERRFFFEGREAPELGGKSEKLMEAFAQRYEGLAQYDLRLDTTNSFPHSAGIASSASGLSALSLCLLSFLKEETGQQTEQADFMQEASEMARLGSGSACRSLYGGYVVWGESKGISGSSDQYATPLRTDALHAAFGNIHDTILLIDRGPKQVSSTAGHGQLRAHPFAQARFEAARHNLDTLLAVLRTGDWEAFGRVIEAEALMLHALMMSGPEPYILMKPNTLAAIEKIQAHRKQSGMPVFFTLDAGANLHLLHPGHEVDQVSDWVEQELKPLCERGEYICDAIGQGPQRLQ